MLYSNYAKSFKIMMSMLFFYPFLLNATNLSCDNLTTSIYYVNGVNNSTADARQSLNYIKNAYKNSYEAAYPRQNFSFKLAYNLSHHYDADVREMVRQKLDERKLLSKSLASEEYQPWQLLYLYERSPEYFKKNVPQEYQFLADIIRTEIQNRCIPKPPQTPERIRTLRQHLAMYKSDLQHGRRVILIPHSQGNLYANSAIRELQNKYRDNIGMIGIASTAAVQLPNTFYITATDDDAINYMRTGDFYFLYTGKIGNFKVLPGNIYNKHSTLWRDITKHGFYKSYFQKDYATGEELASRAKINDYFDYYIKNLKFPLVENGIGALMLTLTWQGKTTDVDLHVTEPDGTNVFYGNKKGKVGTLDRDVTNGLGPEHYFIGCNIPLQGEYKVQAKYFRGLETETVNLLIETENNDLINITKTIENSGDLVDFATIKIEPDADNSGKFIYTIQEQ